MEQKLFQLDNFMGVDYSSSPMNVSRGRATKMRNFINDNGINRKRHGWQERMRLGGRINGIWHFSTKDREGALQTFTVVHAGTKIYTVNLTEGTSNCISTAIDSVRDNRSYGVVYGGKLYLLCGDYLVFGQFSDSNDAWQLRRVVNNTDTYIPTTTIAIRYDGAAQEIEQVGASAANEKPNILATRRRNKLFYDGTTQNGHNVFTVDSRKIDDGKIVITIQNGLSEIRGETDGNTCTVGTVTVTIDRTTGKLTFGAMPISVLEEKDNVTIEFSYLPRDENGAVLEKYEQRITGCTIGSMFGLGGVDDRLFLAGNPAFGNICFHSEITADRDLTYFPDVNTAACGNDGDPITAFSRLGDGTLAIHKRAGQNDANIYFRRGSTTIVTAGGQTVQTEVFPLTAGAIGEGVVSPYACQNLSGDNLILSENGVYGIVLSNNVATDERYARERSRLINARLTELNLFEAVAIVYKNKYYLAVPARDGEKEDYECFMADARYISSAKGDMSDAYNYEWWHFDNIPARVWAILDDTLCFGTEKGSICMFDDQYVDRTYETTESGEIYFDEAENVFWVNKTLLYDISTSDRLTILSDSGLFATYIPDLTVGEDGILTYAPTQKMFVKNNQTVYVYDNETSGLASSPTDAYTIGNVSYSDRTFRLYKDGVPVTPVGAFKLCICLQNSTLQATDVRESFFRVKLPDTETPLSVIRPYSYAYDVLTVRLESRVNVCAEWESPLFDLGNNAYAKNLHSIAISTEPTVGGKIEFGYKTLRNEQLFSAHGVNVFSFSQVDFSDFSFETNAFASVYTKRLKIRNFNYITVHLRSDNDRPCGVNNINLGYSYIKPNKGVN